MTIVTFSPSNPSHAQAFYDLNCEWITTHFVLEDEDREVLSHPVENILAQGGHIWLAEVDGTVVGCIALLKTSETAYELAKMAVNPKFQGQGIGKALGKHALQEATRMGAEKIYIISNTKLTTAIELYRRLGFTESPEQKHLRFARGNITMEQSLPPHPQEAAA